LIYCFAAVKATLIYPATSKHIEKYADQDTYVIEESAALYREVTLPYLLSQKFSIQVSICSECYHRKHSCKYVN